MTTDSKRWRVLTVGDGNFSYSLSFRKQQTSKSLTLVASSYDSLEEILRKYPESARIVTQLLALDASVLHHIDATNLKASLQNQACYDVFDRIVFNHPHCGEENVQRHQSLLSHFFYSAMEIMTSNGEIHVTLAGDQPERWEIEARASQQGLFLAKRIENVDQDPEYGVMYERRRHQNGKSFHRVMLHGEKKQQTSTLFIFTTTPVKEAEEESKQTKETNKAKPETKEAKDVKEEETNGRKRKKPQDHGEFSCDQCEKRFKTQQGVKTHVHMVHALGTNPPKEVKCRYCERVFTSEDGRTQHEISKHGQDPVIRPDWYKAASVSGQLHHKCAICHFAFPSEDALNAHWQQLQPNDNQSFVCPVCSKSFDEVRALRQHQNFCQLKH